MVLFSDRALTQYKDKSVFSDLSHVFMDFGVDAERHFFWTKGPCDREFGTLKKAEERVKTRRARLAWKIFCLNISHKSVCVDAVSNVLSAHI